MKEKESGTYQRKNCDYAKEVLRLEGEALLGLQERIDENFEIALEAVLKCGGQVILTGMGKSGIVGQKISATLASTGTRSVFIHPAEALHGDLGRITEDDIVILLSRSGQTEEILKLIDPIKVLGAQILAMTCNRKSKLAEHADIVLYLGNLQEACPLKLAPSTSTTAMLAMGDALALTVLKHRNFSREQFALYHPAGKLGRKLLKVRQVMRVGEECPIISENATIKEAILLITRAKAGAAICVNDQGILSGIFTDGDLRRYMNKGDFNLDGDTLHRHMIKNPKKMHPEDLASEARNTLDKFKIGEIPVVDDENRPIGVVNIKDLTKMDVI